MKRQYIPLVAFSFLFSLSAQTDARSYPLQEITPTKCVGEDCTLPLPTIQNADYFTYRNLPTYRSTYSMLWLSTYFGGRDVGIGSHQGIDIVTKTWTPVYASHAGEVIVAESRGDRWNVIVIKHQRNGQTLFSTYAHLSIIGVQVGQQVAEREKIGEVGETGNATGPHLHFQLEKNQDGNHPFFPKGCKGTIDEIVNEGTCFSQVREATLDPIVFLEATTKLVEKNETDPQSLYLSAKDITLGGISCGFMETQSLSSLTINKKAGWGIFLSSPITILGGSGLLTFTPEKIQVLEGERKIFLQTNNTTGLALININYGDTTFSSFLLFINTPDKIAEFQQNEKLVQLLKKCKFQK